MSEPKGLTAEERARLREAIRSSRDSEYKQRPGTTEDDGGFVVPPRRLLALLDAADEADRLRSELANLQQYVKQLKENDDNWVINFRNCNLRRIEAEEQVAGLREALRRTAIREWRKDIERDHRIYPGTLCRRCLLCDYRWQEHLGGDLRHASTCLLAAARAVEKTSCP